MKKLLNGKKFVNGFSWCEKVDSILEKYNIINYTKIYQVEINGVKDECTIFQVLDKISNKNFPSIFLTPNNNILFQNDGIEIEILDGE